MPRFGAINQAINHLGWWTSAVIVISVTPPCRHVTVSSFCVGLMRQRQEKFQVRESTCSTCLGTSSSSSLKNPAWPTMNAGGKTFILQSPLVLHTLTTKMSALQVENLFAVAGKVVLVTGGSRGIGKMVCPNCAWRCLKDSVFLLDCLRICEERC